MADLIYRDDALDALRQCKKHCVDIMDSYHIDIEDAEARIRRVPSADPGLDEWCTDCKEYDQKRRSCPRWNRVIRETLNEVEERQKGLEAKCNRLPSLSTPSIGFCAWCKYREKNGYCNEHKLYCDEFDFCSRWESMCGADMRGEHDE